MSSLDGCRDNFLDGLRPPRLFLLDVLLPPFSVSGTEGGTNFGTDSAR